MEVAARVNSKMTDSLTEVKNRHSLLKGSREIASLLIGFPFKHMWKIRTRWIRFWSHLAVGSVLPGISAPKFLVSRYNLSTQRLISIPANRAIGFVDHRIRIRGLRSLVGILWRESGRSRGYPNCLIWHIWPDRQLIGRRNNRPACLFFSLPAEDEKPASRIKWCAHCSRYFLA